MCDLKYWCQCLSTNIKLEESAATLTSHATRPALDRASRGALSLPCV